MRKRYLPVVRAGAGMIWNRQCVAWALTVVCRRRCVWWEGWRIRRIWRRRRVRRGMCGRCWCGRRSRGRSRSSAVASAMCMFRKCSLIICWCPDAGAFIEACWAEFPRPDWTTGQVARSKVVEESAYAISGSGEAAPLQIPVHRAKGVDHSHVSRHRGQVERQRFTATRHFESSERGTRASTSTWSRCMVAR